jgi:hypothetical protein
MLVLVVKQVWNSVNDNKVNSKHRFNLDRQQIVDKD